jgi:hypothetical protein
VPKFYRTPCVNCVQSQTARDIAPRTIVVPIHNIHFLILNIDVTSFPHSVFLFRVYRPVTSWFHCSQAFLCPQLFPICSFPGFVLALKKLSRLNILAIFGRAYCTLVSLCLFNSRNQYDCEFMPSASSDPTVHSSDPYSGGHLFSVCRKIMEITRPESGNVLSKVKIIYRKTDINCVKSYPEWDLTLGQGSIRITLPCHNILNIIVHMAASSIRDSDALMSVYRMDIAWSHYSQKFLTDGIFRPGPHMSWNFFDSETVHFPFIIPSMRDGSLSLLLFKFWGSSEKRKRPIHFWECWIKTD